MPTFQIHCGDALDKLKGLDAKSVQTCVTSPPYFGLRSYGHWFMQTVWGSMSDFTPPQKNRARWLFRLKWRAAERGGVFSPNRKTWIGALGLEPTPELYVEHLVEIMREVRRVLRNDGVAWLNLGDSYAGYWGDKTAKREGRRSSADTNGWTNDFNMNARPDFHTAFDGSGIKPKDLIGIPWMVAFALRADGWYLRSDIIWSKPNPMPESVTDRPTKAHEYIFLLSKSQRYYYDAEAVREPYASIQTGSAATFKRENSKRGIPIVGQAFGTHRPDRDDDVYGHGGRNRRSVWTVNTQPYAEAHFATFPPELIKPCILAGSREGDTILDPFNGAGTTGLVSLRHNRNYVGIDLNPEYVEMSRRRIYMDAPMFNHELAA